MGPGWCGGLRLQKNRNVTPTLILNEHCSPEDKAECKRKRTQPSVLRTEAGGCDAWFSDFSNVDD